MLERSVNLNKVRGYRTMLGKTQEEMAAIIGVSINTYRKMEDNPKEFRVEQATTFLNEVKKLNPDVKMDDIFN